jgi:hypothetical protein
MLDKRFFKKLFFYVIIVLLIHIALFIYLGAYAMADDISTEQRISATKPAIFIINKVFGFPLSLFLPYDPVNAAHLYLWLYITFALNCFIQFSILSFIWRLMSRKNYS